jgi:hypothetical protein
LKEHLSGKRFVSDHEVENETRNWLTNLDANFYAEGTFEISVTLGQMFEPVWRLCGEVS